MLDKQASRRAAALAALLFGSGALAFVAYRPQTPSAEDGAQPFRHDTLELITSGGVRKIDIEIAKTMAEQAQGLMFRTRLADTQGMLFPHDKPRESRMWMRNTYIPLDMVFIRADGTVHRIAAMTEPMSEAIVASEGPVAAVLELNGGAAARLGLKVGDKVRHSHFSSR